VRENPFSRTLVGKRFQATSKTVFENSRFQSTVAKKLFSALSDSCLWESYKKVVWENNLQSAWKE
jgi:hypothetical protein